MKRIMASLLSLSCLCAANAIGVSALEYGDVNGDGKTNIIDAKLIMDYYTEQQSGTALSSLDDTLRESISKYGDLDGNGEINSGDSAVLLKYLKDNFNTGDINGDGIVNEYDARCIMNYYVEKQTDKKNDALTELIRDNAAEYGDIDQNGEINTYDADILLTIILDTGIKGDINCDGLIDSGDASMTLRFYAMNSTGTIDEGFSFSNSAKVLGDMNGDGIIDSGDASSILKEYALRATQK